MPHHLPLQSRFSTGFYLTTLTDRGQQWVDRACWMLRVDRLCVLCGCWQWPLPWFALRAPPSALCPRGALTLTSGWQGSPPKPTKPLIATPLRGLLETYATALAKALWWNLAAVRSSHVCLLSQFWLHCFCFFGPSYIILLPPLNLACLVDPIYTLGITNTNAINLKILTTTTHNYIKPLSPYCIGCCFLHLPFFLWLPLGVNQECVRYPKASLCYLFSFITTLLELCIFKCFVFA